MKKPFQTVSRRRFIHTAGAAATLFSIVPRHVLGGAGQTPPSERLNIAAIGVGGMGAADLNAIPNTHNIVALCDVDLKRGEESFKKFPKARQFRDFRKMFDAMEKEIDAVIVATPDHTHAVASIAAIKRGKHVYCEKPLAHSVHEVRALMKAAREHNVVTQLGNQGHSSDSIRKFVEWVQDGAIGQVHTIHAGCAAVNSGLDQLPNLKTSHPIPDTLDWDLWLGPVQDRPYHPAYLPGSWRGWIPFGSGTVGDWICHVVDPVFWALDLGSPTTVQAEVHDWSPKTQGDAYPKGEAITFEFPAKGSRGPIKLVWHSGTVKIPVAPELEKDDKPVETGAYVYGSKGTIMYGSHGAGGVRLIPDAKMDGYKKPEPRIPRVKGHQLDWLDSIRDGRKSGSDFSYGGPLTELAMIGIIALKREGKKLEWDGQAGKFRNDSAANDLLTPTFRPGWTV